MPLPNSRTQSSHEFVPLFENPDVTRKLTEYDIVYNEKAPKFVKQYKLGNVLGKGSFGKVKEALNTTTSKRCAIKIIKRKKLKTVPRGEEIVKRELAIMKKVNHPNCVRFIEFFEDEEKNKSYLVEELAAGGSVKGLMKALPKDTGLPLAQARNLFGQLLDALAHIHSLGIIHCDVKPDNLLLTPDGVLKLSDFGSARQISLAGERDQPKTGGSFAFQPPELACDKDKFIGPKVDIWAAGVTLYIMTIGKYPFDGDAIGALLQNICSGNYVIPEWVDPSLADLLRNLLQVDAEKRFTLDQIRAHKWMTKKLKYERPVAIPSITSAFTRPRSPSTAAKLFACQCVVI